MNIFQQYISLGLSVIPVKAKICQITSWKQFQEQIPTQEEALLWTGDIACICGSVSGGLHCLDFDLKNGEKYTEWMEILLKSMPELPSKLVIEKTPSGGHHVVYRSGITIKNVKLACCKEGPATIETRGEGGYFVCTPSENYKLIYGSFDKIQKLTDEETAFIITSAMSLNEKIAEQKEERPQQEYNSTELSPFDDYNSRHDMAGLLQKHGWKLLFDRNGVTYYQRPGKDGRGISASWNNVPNRFYVFSTATQFENNQIYKASAVYSILEHAGNYSMAAKELAAQGYGKKETTKPEAKIIDSSEIKLRVKEIYDHGYKKGKTTGWKSLDELYSVIKGQLTVITGMPSMGKSQFLDALMMNLAMAENWKFGVFSPENYPTEMHYHQLVEKYLGKAMLAFNADRASWAEVDKAIDFINNHFYFIDATENEITLDAIYDKAQTLIDTKKIDGFSIDPWNEVELDKPKDLSTTEYVGKSLRISRKFARRNKIHLWIAVHPVKMQKDKEGIYPVPELYDCEGSAMWRNKADNGICIHRHNNDDLTNVIVQKIKYRYTGQTGEVVLRFLKQSGRYEEFKGYSSNVRTDF
jgi:hypothetical protein